jgi:hypothetical protein
MLLLVVFLPYNRVKNDVHQQEIDDHFWHCFLPTTQAHVLWTAHPIWLVKNVDFDDNIKGLVTFVHKKTDVFLISKIQGRMEGFLTPLIICRRIIF